jgi:hypothetical protein
MRSKENQQEGLAVSHTVSPSLVSACLGLNRSFHDGVQIRNLWLKKTYFCARLLKVLRKYHPDKVGPDRAMSIVINFDFDAN